MYQGIALSILASITFGALYFFTTFLQPFNAEQTFAWRMFSTLPFLTLCMLWMGDLPQIKAILQRVFQQPMLILWLLISSALCCSQLWLFLWGPINGRGLQVSLGYFLLPLVMVLLGCVIFKEKLSRWQIFAVLFALVGVAHEVWRLGSIAWETLYVAIAYPIYFFLRRAFKTDNLGGFWWDLFLILPVAFYFAFVYSDSLALIAQFEHLIWAIIGLGFLSTLGLGSYMLASRYLPFVIFGLLSYFEPVLLAFSSIALGERVNPEEWLTYIPIWCAVFLLMIEGCIHVIRQRRKQHNLQQNVENYQKRLADQPNLPKK